MTTNVHYDEETDSFIFENKYKLTAFEKKLKDHFKDGGLNNKAVLAGVCNVSRATMMRWLDKNSRWYKPELAQLIDMHEPESVAMTDKWHRESASGKRRFANAQTLNRRAEKLLDLKETIKTEQLIKHHYESVEEIDAEIKRLKDEQDNA